MQAKRGETARIELFAGSSEVLDVLVVCGGPGATFGIVDGAGLEVLRHGEKTEELTKVSMRHTFALKNVRDRQLFVELRAGQKAKASLGLQVQFSDGWMLVHDLPPRPITDASQPLLIRARFQSPDGRIAPATEASGSLILVPPSRRDVTMELGDDGQNGDQASGDGILSTVVKPDAMRKEGHFAVHMDCRAKVDGKWIQRTCAASFAVQKHPSTDWQGPLEYTLDEDGDGLFDAVVFEWSGVITAEGYYVGLGELVASDGTFLCQPRADLKHEAGTRREVFKLTAKAEELQYRERDGPWRLEKIYFMRDDAVNSPVDLAPPDRQTKPYALSSFERPHGPRITVITPDHGPRAGGTEVRFAGSGFLNLRRVTVDGQPVEYTDESYSTFLVRIPPARTSDKSVKIVVATKWGESTIDDYTYD